MRQERTAQWTLAEVHRLPDDGNRYELVHGELFVTPAPSYAHQAIVDVLITLLHRYVEAESLGRIQTPRSVIRVRGSETEPDLMVRPVPSTIPDDWEAAPLPSLVVEVLSGSTRRRDHEQKRELYLEIGVPEYWIVDGARRTIRVVRQGRDDVVVDGTLSWYPEGAREALAIDVSLLFRAALG